jgi:ribonuclease T2
VPRLFSDTQDMRRLVVIGMIAVCFLAVALAQSGKRPASSAPGTFDYYVLSLSWSPLYCADPQNASRDPEQCGQGRRYAFVTHGLWPNNEQPPHPRDCETASPVPANLVTQMLGIMPSPALIRHEWRAHGTCSGMNVSDYFATVRAAYKLINIPQRYRSPATDLVVPAAVLRKDFFQANRGIPVEAMRFDCRGRNLRELRICLTSDLKPRSCSAAVRDTCGDRPVTTLKVR